MNTNWVPAAVLPNLYSRQALEGDVIALAPPDDPRVQKICSDNPNFQEFISRFTNAFEGELAPVVMIIRDDAASKLSHVEPLASFRDVVALCIIPYARSLGIVYRNGHRISYSNSLWLYPWMLSKDNQHMIAQTPAMKAIHVVEQFHGQSSPEIPEMQLAETDIDKPLFEALMRRWKRYYLGTRQRWSDRALFRSLNMASQAALLPAGVDTTVYDLGRMISLWVSAFEILAHPRTSKSGPTQVYGLLERVSYLDRKVGSRAFMWRKTQGKRVWPRRPLPCWLYSKLYRARCDFLHGNPIKISSLNTKGAKVGLFWVAPSLYRLALTGFLALAFRRRIPSLKEAKKLGEYIASKMRFERFQEIIERSLLRARK